VVYILYGKKVGGGGGGSNGSCLESEEGSVLRCVCSVIKVQRFNASGVWLTWSKWGRFHYYFIY
jgi:hypothetical protein